MRKEIEDLLNSSESAYAISKETGVSTSVILDLRNKKRKLDNLSLLNAERLYNYYEEMENMGKIKEIQSWLKGFGTVEKYDQFKNAPDIIENAQPKEYVSFYYSNLEDEKESMEFEGSYEELAEVMNLDEAKPNETFIQLNAIDWADSTNATAFYLSDVESKEKFMQYVNEALEIDQVTHSSGLKPKYQFI